MITNKFTNAKLAKEIERLNREVTSLKSALLLAADNNSKAEQLETMLEGAAAENAHLLARLHQLGDPNMCDLVVELMALKVTGKLCARLQARGYREAVADVRAVARTARNPQIYDLMMDICGQMDAKAARVEAL